MKGYLAIMMVAATEASARNLKRPLHFAFSYDEEVGCLGAWPLAKLIKETLPDHPPIIVGEPTRSKIVGSHKGIATFQTTVKGYSVHSSRVHEGVSAVTEGARLVTWLDDLMREDASKVISEVFDPPFTTIHCGKISGGNAVNVVAAECSFTTDVRTIEGQDPRDYEAQFEKHVAEKVLPILKVGRKLTSVSSIFLSLPDWTPKRTARQ